MSQRLAKEEMALLMPNRLSHYFENDREQLAPAARPGLFDRAGQAVRWLIDLPRRRAVLNELHALSAHELADIGLSRADLGRVFDPEFAVRRNNERVTARLQNGCVIRA